MGITEKRRLNDLPKIKFKILCEDEDQSAVPAVRTLALLSRPVYIDGLAEYSTAQSSVTLAMFMM